MRRDILVWPDDTLRQISQPVDLSTEKEEIRQLVSDMVDTLWQTKTGVALSAIQIGVPKRVVLFRDDANGWSVWLNPHFNPDTWPPDTAQIEVPEGCLSFPNVQETILRYKSGTLTGLEWGIYGGTVTPLEKFVTGLEAQAAQHELEHLDGRLMIDYLPEGRVKTITNKLKKWKTKGYVYPPRMP